MALPPGTSNMGGLAHRSSLCHVSGHGDPPLAWGGRTLRPKLFLGSAPTSHVALDEHSPALGWASLWKTRHVAKPTG